MEYERMEKGQKPSWAAMKYGCCASVDVVDEGRAALRANGESDMQICYEQPQSIPQPRAEPQYARPSTSQSMSRHVSQWVSSSRDFATRASSRASISTLTRPRRSQSRPSIGRPTDFRHFDGVDGIQSMVNDAPMPIRRRRSFRPLELSIYLPDGCGRLSPLPDFEELEVPAQALVRVRDSRTDSLSSNPSTSSYLIQRKAVGSGSRRSSLQSQKSASTSTQERRLSGTTMATMATPTLPFLPEEPKSSAESYIDRPTIQRSRTSGTLSPARVLSRLPSPSRSRANTAPSRPGSLRRARTDVDEAIRELNTIVEERRASAYRSQTQSPALISRPPMSPSHHVPYIAPSMRMHVRSETLSDIGSAFSAPLSLKPLPNPPTADYTPAKRATMGLTLAPPVARSYTGPLTSNPITPPAPHTPTTPISRLGAWIKRSTTSLTPSSRPTTPKTADSSFYKCEPNPLPLPQQPASSRPSTAGSRTIITSSHARQDSNDSNATATVTLFSSSSYPSTRSASPTSTSTNHSTTNTTTTTTSSPPRKSKRVPAPLNLAIEKEIAIETALASARSTRSFMNAKPPLSPNVGLLRGMEISARDVGVHGERRSGMGLVPSPGAVGVAF
ncbi:Nn.00g031720.m01.CDS01 [Neocucurbitaria sp. VM-36]